LLGAGNGKSLYSFFDSLGLGDEQPKMNKEQREDEIRRAYAIRDEALRRFARGYERAI